jgi:hypothetical protein
MYILWHLLYINVLFDAMTLPSSRSAVGHGVEVPVAIAREAVGDVHLADEMAVLALGERRPQTLIYMAIRTRRHGMHLLYLVLFSILLVGYGYRGYIYKYYEAGGKKLI